MGLQDDERLAEIKSSPFDVKQLRPGGTLRIGRHCDNDIVWDDPTVSRFHATIRWDEHLERPLLYDNGSQNGSNVDGNVVHNKAVPLTHGSTIEISGHIATVELRNCGETPAILTSASDMVTLFSDQGPEIKGQLGADAALTDLLQRLEVERRSGTLTLNCPEPATITHCLGKIMAASYKQHRNRQALEFLLAEAPAGDYFFRRELEPTEQSLDLWFSAFLREQSQSNSATRIYKRPTALEGHKLPGLE